MYIMLSTMVIGPHVLNNYLQRPPVMVGGLAALLHAVTQPVILFMFFVFLIFFKNKAPIH
jgi:hypothetical protein